MDIGVPSRFACLKIEDEDVQPQAVKQKEAKKKVALSKKCNKDVKEAEEKVNGGTKKGINNKQDTSQTPVVGSKKEKKKQNPQESEQLTKKECETVNRNLQPDLVSELLISPIVNEEKKQSPRQRPESLRKPKRENKKKKNKTTSLEQEQKEEKSEISVKLGDRLMEEDFFNKIKMVAKKQLNNDQMEEIRKKFGTNIDRAILLAKYQRKLEEANTICLGLKKEMLTLKLEIAAVKERNKTLCDILGQGEMRDKAQVLLELEKLCSEKRQLSEEVSRLHVQLQQERSKVASLMSDSKHKEKKRKHKG